MSAYWRLDDYLPDPPPHRLVLQFEELEALTGEPLPPNARAKTDWWLTAWRPESCQWQLESLYLHSGIVIFRRLR
jgi:hypothetical protein